jgi:hypothetical protein
MGAVTPGSQGTVSSPITGIQALLNGNNGLSPDAVTGAFLRSWLVPDAFSPSAPLAVDLMVHTTRDVPGVGHAEHDRAARAVVPPMNEVLTYDRRGNRETDAFWTYEWDGAGRLTHLVTRTPFIVMRLRRGSPIRLQKPTDIPI